MPKRSGGKCASFTTGAASLPVADDSRTSNVATLRDQPISILTLYHRLIELRRAEPALSVGEFASLPGSHDVMAYLRQAGDRRFVILLNFAARPCTFDLSALNAQAVLLLSTHLDRNQALLSADLQLRKDEGVVVELRKIAAVDQLNASQIRSSILKKSQSLRTPPHRDQRISHPREYFSIDG